MKKHLKRFKDLIFDRPLEEVLDIWEQKGPKQAIKKAVPFLATRLGALALVLVLLYVGLGVLWKFIAPVLVIVVLIASYFENRKPSINPLPTKEPTMAQYVTVGNIMKVVAKRVGPVLGLAILSAESDIKAAKDERIVPNGKCWFFKYRFLKKNISTDVDTDTAQRALQSELRTVLDNDNPAGFDKVRFVYGGVDECILQIDRVAQDDLYLYLYCCYASEDYFNQREKEVEQHDTADTGDIDF